VVIWRVILSVLVAASQAGAQGLSPAGAAAIRNPAKAALPAVASRAVAVDDGTLVPGAGAVPGEPVFESLDANASALSLDAIFNSHWTGVDRFVHGGEVYEVSVTFDLVGETYLTILPPRASLPHFYRLERSMDGRWRTGASEFRADIAITNIFCRLCNHIRIQTDGGERVYYKEIQQLVNAAYDNGRRVVAGGSDFRVYFSNDLDRQPEGRIVDDRFGIVIAYDLEQGQDDPDLKRLIVPFSELQDGHARRYRIEDGPSVVLRIDPATRTLFLSSP
jgi:hypothetical protein